MVVDEVVASSADVQRRGGGGPHCCGGSGDQVLEGRGRLSFAEDSGHSLFEDVVFGFRDLTRLAPKRWRRLICSG
jgi:hypothetical protein